MFATFLTLALFAASAITVRADDLSIGTPSIKQCTPVNLSWKASKGPYNLIVVDPANPCTDVIVDLGDINGTSFSWTPKLKKGTKIQLSLQDANEDEGWSGPITIGDGPDDCLSTLSTKTNSTGSGSSTTGSTTTNSPNSGSTGAPAPVGAAGNDPIVGGDDSAASTTRISLPILAISGLIAAVTLL